MNYADFKSRVLIPKGWSGDNKYCVTDATGQKMLLRVSPAGEYERKKSEFEQMQRVAELGIPMCMPLEFGRCDEGVYSLQSWIDGSDAIDVIPTLAPEKAYAYGIESGRILRRIHTLPAPPDCHDWAEYFNKKADRKISNYRSCPLKFDGAELMIEYLNSNRNLLDNRPQCFQHGDYHIGNMMIECGRLVIIDFNRYDFGDPWEEFNRIVWSAQNSPAFARGMVDGYFDGMPPLEFWKLLKFYIFSNMLSSLPWAIAFGNDEVEIMLAQAQDVLGWYGDVTNHVPAWYAPVNK